MFRPEIMTDVEAFAYYGAKVALNDIEERERNNKDRSDLLKLKGNVLKLKGNVKRN